MLKQLKLQAELKQRKTEMMDMETRKKEFESRSVALGVSLEEAESEEDVTLVQEEIATLEQEVEAAGLEVKISAVEDEITRIEGALDELAERAKATTKKIEAGEKRGGVEAMNKYQVRDMLKNGTYYERAEVKDFYEQFKNIRTVGGEGLLIPEAVVNRILDIMGDYSTLYPIIDTIRVSGKTRILIDTDTTAAVWIEQNGAVPTGEVGTITNIDFDGFKIGKLTAVDNSMLQDSIINLDDYVVRKIARAIAIGLDIAILRGEGSAKKQPDGIIPKLKATHKVTVNEPKGYADIVKPIGLIDTGADSIGEIVAVMKRSTYYNRLLGFSVQPTATGNVIAKLPNLSAPDLLGLRIVFNNNMDEDKILYGDFKQYTMVERESITIDSSEHVKFTEDQMAFRGKGRFDGKPTKPEAFVLVTLAYAPEV